MFKEFAEICPYKIDLGSIKKRPEPEPDILCELLEDGLVAFELAEIVDEHFARQVDGGAVLRQRFVEASQALPAFRRKFADASIYVEFFDEISDRVRTNSIGPIFERLEALKFAFDGDVPIAKHSQLQKVLRRLEVHRSTFEGPIFSLMKSVKRIDHSIELLRKKFAKSYTTSAPIELLAHFYRQPPSSDSEWIQGVRGYVTDRLRCSMFRRIWIYDRFSREIAYVFPDLSSKNA